MCTVYGYCRVSTTKQRLERQIKKIHSEYPEAVIVADEYTGTTFDRPAWLKMYKKLKAGDTVVFDEVSRMSRDADEGCTIYEELFQKGVNLIFLKERHIDTDVYRQALQTKIQLTGSDIDPILKGINEYFMILAKKQIRIAFETAQHEIDMLHARTKEGVMKAQANGKTVGRPAGSKFETEVAKEAKAMILKHSVHFKGSLNNEEVIKIAECSRNSFYKYVRELKDEISNGKDVYKAYKARKS